MHFVTEGFLERVYAISESLIPQEVYDRAQYHLLDYIGVSHGSRGFDEQNNNLYRVIERVAREGGARLVDRNVSLASPFTAFYNAAVNHTIEMDDTNSEASAHPSSVVISAALACGQELGCTGKQVLRAIIIGYEVMIRLGKALNPAVHYAKGFHPTATCGVFGAAAAASLLMGADCRQFKNAIGFAGSYASGNCKYQTEATVAKRLQPAIAAKNGVFAALEACEGLEGPKTIFDEYNGFLASHSNDIRTDKLFEQLGSSFQMMKTGLKFYPCCRYIHGPLDGICSLMREHMLDKDTVCGVRIEVTSVAMPIVAEPADSKRAAITLFDKQFSLYYCAAFMLAVGEMNLDVFLNDKFAEACAREQIDKISVVCNSDLDICYPEYWPVIVTLSTASDEYKVRIDSCMGEPDKFIPQEVEKKFFNLTARAMDEKIAREIKKVALNLKNEEKIDGLFPVI